MNLSVVGLDNVGFMVVDYIASKCNVEYEEFPTVYIAKSREFYLVKPKLFMNNSGKALLSAPIPISKMKIVVVYDDADIPFGKIGFRRKINSVPTHGGLKDIYLSLGRDDIMRLRIGVSRPPHNVTLSEWVLSEFSEEEKKILPVIFEKSYQAIMLIAKGKMDMLHGVLS